MQHLIRKEIDIKRGTTQCLSQQLVFIKGTIIHINFIHLWVFVYRIIIPVRRSQGGSSPVQRGESRAPDQLLHECVPLESLALPTPGLVNEALLCVASILRQLALDCLRPFLKPLLNNLQHLNFYFKSNTVSESFGFWLTVFLCTEQLSGGFVLNTLIFCL